MDMTKLEEIKVRHKSRMDEGWITINGTHVMVDKDGNLSGKIGEKISQSSSKKTTEKKEQAQPSSKGGSVKLSSEEQKVVDELGKTLMSTSEKNRGFTFNLYAQWHRNGLLSDAQMQALSEISNGSERSKKS